MTTQIRAEIRLDDLASGSIKTINAGLFGLNKTVSSITSQFTGFVKVAAAMTVGANLFQFTQRLKEASTVGVRAAMQAQNEMRELTKISAGMSKGKAGFAGYYDQAKLTYRELSNISNATGVARSELVKTFVETGANTVKTRSQLVDLIGRVAAAEKALPAPVDEVVAGFKEIETNTISANNPIISMVKQANLIRGHSERIAQQWQFLGRAELTRRAEQALKILGDRAKSIPPTLEEMSQRMVNMRTDTLRLVGEPMLRALMPVFDKFSKYLEENQGRIQGWAHMVGVKAGHWIQEAADKIQKGFQYILTHSQEISNAIKEGWSYVKSVMQFVVDHKNLLIGAAVGQKIAGVAGSIGSAVGGVDTAAKVAGVAGGASGIWPALRGAIGQGAAGIGVGAAGMATGTSMLMFAGAVGALVASISVFSEAVNKFANVNAGEWFPGLGGVREDLNAQMEFFERMSHSASTAIGKNSEEFQKMKAEALRNAEILGDNVSAVRKMIDAYSDLHQKLVSSTTSMKIAAVQAEQFSGGGAFTIPPDQSQEVAKSFLDGFNATIKSGSSDAGKVITESLMDPKGGSALQEAILNSGQMIGLSLEQLADVIEFDFKEYADKLRQRSKELAKLLEEKGQQPTAVFNHNQFQIKQDFRDQDPDRIAVVFRRDIARNAIARVGSKTGIFGGY